MARFPISSVVMPDHTTIEVTFSDSLDASSASPLFFSITAPFGAVTSRIVAASYATEVATLTLASGLTHGLEYSISTLEGLIWSDEGPVTPSTATFTSVGDPPKVSNAVAVDTNKIVVKFDRAMVNDADLTDRFSYLVEPTVSGKAPTIRSVSRVTSSSVILETTTMKGSSVYQVIVSNGPCDVARNCVDPEHNSATFTSKATSPKIAQIEKRGPNIVSIHFDRPMLRNAAIEDPHTYTIPGLKVLGASLSGDRRRVDLIVSNMALGVQYAVSIAV